MGSRLLLVVEDVFAVEGRGVIVAPDVDLGPVCPQRLNVELRRPDGSATRAEASAHVPFVQPLAPGSARRHVVMLAGLTKAEVPPGTEIWILDDM